MYATNAVMPIITIPLTLNVNVIARIVLIDFIIIIPIINVTIR